MVRRTHKLAIILLMRCRPMKTLSLIVSFVACSVSCQLSPWGETYSIESVEGGIESARVSSDGILELLPDTGGFLFFTSVEMVDIAIWFSSHDGIQSYYHAFLPAEVAHRLSLHEMIPLALAEEFQLPTELESSLTLVLRGIHIAAPGWPLPRSRSPSPFAVTIRLPKRWLVEAFEARSRRA